MRKIIFAIMTILALTELSLAQTTKLIFGPRDGDNAGIIRTHENDSVDIDVWIRTAPGIGIVAFHFPL